MSEYLTIAQAAALLGVTVDTVRVWEHQGRLRAYRTAGGHRRFLAEEVRSLGGPRQSAATPGGRAGGLPNTRESLPTPSQLLGGRESAYWPGRARDARAKLEAIRAREATRELIQGREAEEARARADAEAAARERECRQRLDALKEYGRQRAYQAGLPPEWRARVTADLETYVSPIQFPSSLPEDEARSFVAARVNEIVEEFRAECARLEQDEERRRERQRTHARVQGLVAFGMTRAGWATLLWDSTESERAKRELERELRARVRSDWTETDVSGFVEDFLEEVDEEDEDDKEDG